MKPGLKAGFAAGLSSGLVGAWTGAWPGVCWLGAWLWAWLGAWPGTGGGASCAGGTLGVAPCALVPEGGGAGRPDPGGIGYTVFGKVVAGIGQEREGMSEKSETNLRQDVSEVERDTDGECAAEILRRAVRMFVR